jgi:hypothetical protein
MAGWAVLQNRITQRANTADFSSSPLIEGLQLEGVSSITITSDKGKQTTTLDRNDQTFVVADKENYPADVATINSVINDCLDIRAHEKVTDNPGNHADLGVTEETAQFVVHFLDKDGGQIVGLAVSEAGENGAAFARRLSSNDVYSIQNPPRVTARPMDYVDAQLFEIQQDKIQSVVVKTDEGRYELTVTGDKRDIQLNEMPAGKQFKGTDYKSVFGALSSLRFDDVASEEKAPEGLEFNSSYVCTLSDKTVYHLDLAQQDDKTYAKISADFLDKTPVQKTMGQVESEEELKAKEAKLMAIDAVNAFNRKHQGWVYEIPSYKAGNLTKPLPELLEDAPEPEKKPGPTDPNAVQ